MEGNTYDQVSYSHLPTTETHPDRLAALARLRGLNPPPVDRARVLDLGANEGGCLIPMALSLPHAQFTGIDLAAAPVERGNRVVAELGLGNARLIQMNLLDAGASLGEFDYVIAHGLYAWTPEAVRDKVLAIASANLSRTGIAMVSYNTYPGAYERTMLRDMMLFHADGAAEPADRIRQARAILALMARANPEAKGISKAVAQEAERTLLRRDSAIFHDYMSDVYQPVYFRDFVAHAARHGLAYVEDASVIDTWNVSLTAEAQESVRQIAAGDRILREQYLDLLRVRHFRCSLLCHDSAAPRREWVNANAAEMFAASPVQETGPGTFVSPIGVRVETAHQDVIEFLRRCLVRWPEALPIAGQEAEMAVALFQRGLIEMRTVPGLAKRAGDRPLASPLARYQVLQGPTVSTLLHTAVEIPHPAAREFLKLLDGTRDRPALARESACSLDQVDQELEKASAHGLLLG
jgi:predicted methyltransferase family protein/protein-lysine methyltransferase-like protein/methyltransferase family protein